MSKKQRELKPQFWGYMASIIAEYGMQPAVAFCLHKKQGYIIVYVSSAVKENFKVF